MTRAEWVTRLTGCFCMKRKTRSGTACYNVNLPDHLLNLYIIRLTRLTMTYSHFHAEAVLHLILSLPRCGFIGANMKRLTTTQSEQCFSSSTGCTSNLRKHCGFRQPTTGCRWILSWGIESFCISNNLFEAFWRIWLVDERNHSN